MNIGIRLHDTAKDSFENRIRKVHEDGFSCGHLALYAMLTEYPCEAAALTPGYAMHIRRIFEKNNVDIAVLGCYLNLGHPDAHEIKKIQEKYKAHIRFASLLGAGVVGTETGCPNPEYRPVPENKTEESYQLFLKNFRPVVEYAEKMGVIIAIEPVATHIIHSPKVARRVLDDINSPNLGIIFDPVNLLDINNYKNQKEICREAIELLGDDIMMLHIKDFTPETDKLSSMAAGLGIMDYSDIVKFVKEKKPFVHMTLEDTTPDNAVAARLYMEKLFNEV